MIKSLTRSLIGNLIGLYFATVFLTGFIVEPTAQVYVTAAIILMIVNHFIRPILNIISFPINLLTLGIFSILLNLALIYLTFSMISGITIRAGYLTFESLGMFALTFPEIELSKLLTIIVASLIISIVHWIIDLLI